MFQLCNKAIIRAPVHPLWLRYFHRIRVVHPSEAFAYFVCTPLVALKRGFPLNRIDELMAMSACEKAPAIEFSDAPTTPTRWASEPLAVSAVVTWLRKKAHWIVVAFPFFPVITAPI
ncbi:MULTISPECIES: hypothetical protein [unclassified Ruegeria]|uniref:hypothetical protein n=1 Tax=unclassified Ruegeria TaxID=2625375 RepID=UPI0014882607|nr:MULTISPECIES: hypothetical protein [unclassified Ruegeria]